MNSEQSLDFLSQISIPQWMINNTNVLIDNPFPRDSQRFQNKNNLKCHNEGHKFTHSSLKRSSPLQNQHPSSYQISPESNQVQSIEQLKVSDSLNYDSSEKFQKYGKKNSKDKLERRCQNSRKYRQRKREYFKSLQVQNKFLKSKVDQLTFKLNEKQREINRLKHNDPQFTQNFHIAKSECLKQVEQILRKNEASHQQMVQAQNKLQKVLSFDSKQKVDYLNYFMSQLLQNVINDRTFYFMDCLINKRGVHRQSDKQQLRKIDIEVLELLNIDQSKIKQSFIQNRRIQLAHEARRLKQLWKKLYQVYLAILNQGIRLQRIVEPMKAYLMSFVNIQNFLRVELHFEKNKYRSDIRYLRNSWFKQLQYQSFNGQKQRQKQGTSTKRTKFQ